MTTETNTLVEGSWELSQRPLSASVAQFGEVAVAYTEEPAGRTPRMLAPEQYPGVRDVDRDAGIVQMEDGRTVSLARFLGRQNLAQAFENRG